MALLVAPAAASEGSCPNEQLRAESNINPNTGQHYSQELPDCRAFEMVTPPDKNLSTPGVSGFSSDGSRVFGNAISSYAGGFSNLYAGGNDYEDVRTPSGWQTTPLDPSPNEIEVTIGGSQTFSDAGEVIITGRPAGGFINEDNLYRVNPSGAATEIGPMVPQDVIDGYEQSENEYNNATLNVLPDGASADLSHVFFEDLHAHWPGDPLPDEAPNRELYEYTGSNNAEPEMVGVKNQTSLAEAARAEHKEHINEAAEVISKCGTALGSEESRQPSGEGRANNTHNAVSHDGMTVFFTAANCEGQLPVKEIYARVDRTHTVAISQPQALASTANPDCKTSECIANTTNESNFRDAGFIGASANGGKVFFTDPQQLTDQATEDSNPADSGASRGVALAGCPIATGANGCNLYMYDFEKPVGERLVDLSAGDTSGLGPEVQGVEAVSEDGSHVYFVAKSVLTGAERNEYGASAQADRSNLYGYDTDTGKTTFVAVLGENPGLWERDLSNEYEYDPQTTPDGRFLLFHTEADITPDDTTGSVQLFRFDSQSDQLVRVSIGENGYNNDGNILAAPIVRGPAWEFGRTYDGNPAISDDGSTVVFESEGALTPAAQSGVVYIYEYENGNVYLIASGRHEQVELAGIDHSGGDIFIATPSALVAQDNDTAMDIYDARADGGFAQPGQPSTCGGESCQGSLTGPSPTIGSPGSVTLSGVGSVSPTPSPKAPIKPQTRAQKLARALKLCRKKTKRKRATCTRQANKRYGRSK
jgi:Tol biopolymer transport system component